jgi:hypothetical protein
LQEAVGLSKEAARRVAKDFKFDLSVLKPQLNPEEFPHQIALVPSIQAILERFLSRGSFRRADASLALQELGFPQTGRSAISRAEACELIDHAEAFAAEQAAPSPSSETSSPRGREDDTTDGETAEKQTALDRISESAARPDVPELPEKVRDVILTIAREARENDFDDNPFYRLLGTFAYYLIDSSMPGEELLRFELNNLRLRLSRTHIFSAAIFAYRASRDEFAGEFARFVRNIANSEGLGPDRILNSTLGRADFGKRFFDHLPKEMRDDIRRERGEHGPIIGHGFGPDELRDPKRTPITPNVPGFTKVLEELQDTLQAEWPDKFVGLASVARERTPVAEFLTRRINTAQADLISVLEDFRFGGRESGITPVAYESRAHYHFGFGLSDRLALADVFFDEQHPFYNKRGAAGLFLVEEAAFHELVHAVLGAEGEQDDEVVHELAIRWQAVLYWRLNSETVASLDLEALEHHDANHLGRALRNELKQRVIDDELKQRAIDAEEYEEYEVVVGIPKGVYDALKGKDVKGFAAWESGLKEERNIRLVVIEADEEDAKIEELEGNIGDGKVVAALLDVDGRKRLDEINLLLINLKEKMVKDIIHLTNPEISALTQENIRRIKKIEEIRGILPLLIRTLPQGASYRLGEKSIYDIRIKKVYDMHRKEYSQRLGEYLSKDAAETERDIMVSVVDNALDMKVLAEAIRERRSRIPADKKDDPITDYVIVSSKVFDEVVPAGSREARLQGIKAFLGETGLDEIRGDKNVIILGEEEARDLTPEGVLEIIAGKERIPIDDEDMMKNLRKRTAIGQKSMIITVDSETPDELFKGENGLVFVQQDPGKGIASQMYRIMLEIRANNGRRPSAVVGTLVQINNSRMFTYTPDIEPIDLKEEIRAYERYVREVLVRA